MIIKSWCYNVECFFLIFRTGNGFELKKVDIKSWWHGWYEWKRTHNWLKAKPFIEVTLRVVAIEEGTGRNEGRLGAILVEGTDDQYNYRLNCGSGFSDSQREEYWSKKDKLIGQLVEIRADARTQSQDAETFSLRFPRFKCFRGFEPGEKI